MSVPELIGNYDSPWFARDAHGQAVLRRRQCECGRAFTQALLSERFMTAVERHSERAAALTVTEIPGLYVPVHCPPCESRDLRRVALMHGYREPLQRDHSGAAD